MLSGRSGYDLRSPIEPADSANGDYIDADSTDTSEPVPPRSVTSRGPTPQSVVFRTHRSETVRRERESFAVEVADDEDARYDGATADE